LIGCHVFFFFSDVSWPVGLWIRVALAIFHSGARRFSQKGVDVLQLIAYLGNLLLSNIDCETTAKATAFN